LRILKLSDVYFPRVNGVSTSIQTFRQSLHELGHETVLLAPDYGDPGQREEAGVRRVAARRVPLDPEDRMMQYRRLLGQARDALRGGGYDVVHVHTPFLAHHAGVRPRRQFGVPVVETYHTYFEEYLHHYAPFLPGGALRLLARRFTVSQCRAVDALVVPTHAMLEVLRRYGVAARAEVIPTGLDPERFTGGDGNRFRRRLGIPSGQPLLVHISRVAHEKNIDFVLRVFQRVHSDRPGARLVIAGEGPAEASLRSLAARLGLQAAVHFVGYLDRAGELLDCYRAADAFVFASRTETQGLVLLEAMALGVPVVSTAVLGTTEVLRDAEGAIVVREEESEFAAAVLGLLDDPELQATLRAGGARTAAQWSATSLAGRMAELYRDVAGGAAEALGEPVR